MDNETVLPNKGGFVYYNKRITSNGNSKPKEAFVWKKTPKSISQLVDKESIYPTNLYHKTW